MGGHSKKSGRGGGGGGGRGGRSARHERARALKKDPGVPDLRAAASRLAHTAAKRTHSLFAHTHNNGSGALSRSVWQRRAHGSGNAADEARHNGDDDNNDNADARRAEMTSLALRAAERLHEHHAPLQLLLDGEHDSSYGRVAAQAGDAAAAAATAAAHERSLDAVAGQRRRGGAGVGSSLRRFYKSFQRVVESCDVLLHVVDARDPLGCRLTSLEQSIRSTYGDDRKTIVIVLNKVDLLPSPQIVDAWVAYFEQHEHLLCVPFSATAKGASGQSYVSLLYRRLRALARGNGGSGGASERKAIVVGVIGYPNVGKSSIINALKRRPVVGVGNVPGFTTGSTEVELRRDIRVLDCPGVVCPGGGHYYDNNGNVCGAVDDDDDEGGGGGGDVVLRNAVKISDVANPIAPVQRLLQRCTRVQQQQQQQQGQPHDATTTAPHVAHTVHPLALYYGIAAFDVSDVYDFLHHVGVRRGKLLKGGRVDEEATARMVLHDWNDGRIAYYTLPPTVASLHADGSLRAADYDADAAAAAAVTATHSHRHDDNDDEEQQQQRRGQARDNSDDGSSGSDSMRPRLVAVPSCGLIVDGLPSFHLNLRGIERQRDAGGKWAAAQQRQQQQQQQQHDDDDEEEL